MPQIRSSSQDSERATCLLTGLPDQVSHHGLHVGTTMVQILMVDGVWRTREVS